jgi:hypothetical protein
MRVALAVFRDILRSALTVGCMKGERSCVIKIPDPVIGKILGLLSSGAEDVTFINDSSARRWMVEDKCCYYVSL